MRVITREAVTSMVGGLGVGTGVMGIMDLLGMGINFRGIDHIPVIHGLLLPPVTIIIDAMEA